jgi:hypothetical protein
MAVSSQIVSVNITLGTRSPVAANFGVPAVFCKSPVLGGKLYEISSEGLAAMVTDGFVLTDRGYEIVSTMSSQNPHADQVLVYGRTALTTSIVDITPQVTTEGAVYNFDLTYAGVTSTITYEVPASATVNTICDAIEVLIDASPAGIAGAAVAPDNATATKLTFTGGTPGQPVMLSNFNPAMLKVLDMSTNASIATDLAAAAVNHEFYRFVIDSFSEAENNAAAAWAEANSKRFFAHSADSTNIVDAAGTGVGKDFFDAGYHRSVVVQSGDMPGNAAASLVARQSALDPGTSGYAFKELPGVVPDALTSSQLSNAAGKNILVYALDQGSPHTFFGKAASGRSLRIQDAIDLLDARVAEAVLSTFLSNEYIPYSDAGFAQMESAVRGVLMAFLTAGVILSEGLIVTVPRAASATSADKIAGRLNSLKFSCVMPNDLLKITVNGVVSF